MEKKNDIEKKLGNLSEQEIDQLADLMGVGFLNKKGSIDKNDKILALSTEPKNKICDGLKKLKSKLVSCQ